VEPADETVSDQEVLLQVYSQLVAVKRLLVALVAVAVLFGATALFESSRSRSEDKADALVECLVAGRRDC
jgi:hypothetical protein